MHATQQHAKSLASHNSAAAAGQFTLVRPPIDRASLSSRRLLDMIEQIEILPAPGNRTIWEMLLDAGAEADLLQYRDPKDDRFSVFHAALQFRISTAKHKGFLVLEDDPENRCYRIRLQRNEGIAMEFHPKHIFLKNLASEIYQLVDDGIARSRGTAAPELIADENLSGSHVPLM